jgi:hypothetical protein
MPWAVLQKQRRLEPIRVDELWPDAVMAHHGRTLSPKAGDGRAVGDD